MINLKMGKIKLKYSYGNVFSLFSNAINCYKYIYALIFQF